jgi:acetoin utilization deacetylase AcuC-like enzyme
MKNKKIKVYYMPQMAYVGEGNSFSNSPKKPKLFVQKLKQIPNWEDNFEIVNFKPFEKNDFLIAHKFNYVESFFTGKGNLKQTNDIEWSPELVTTIQYTNASLFAAIEQSIINPLDICCSPTSGFHHAEPRRGYAFCTFSGQVIASLKIYWKYKKVGAYMDLDAHFGNSIEDHKEYYNTPELENAIPNWANFNPYGEGEKFMNSYKKCLEIFKEKAIQKEVDYVVWCHGADSCKGDDIGGNVDEKDWILCTKLFVECIKEIEQATQQPFPVSYSLFGGYRDNYDEVIALHVADTLELLQLSK